MAILYLLLSIGLSVLTVLCFKWFERFQVPTFQAIVVNYLVCVLVGNLLSEQPVIATAFWEQEWFVFTAFLGVLFITIFYAIGRTAQQLGVSVSMVAAKLSVVVPVLAAILLHGESFTTVKAIGICLSLIAVWFMQQPPQGESTVSIKLWFLPVVVFVGSGLIDTLLNYLQQRYIPPATASDIVTTVFLVACLIGIGTLLVMRKPIQWRAIGWGLLLGVPNYFCMFFLVKTLAHFDATLVFPINNIAIVIGASIASFFLFKERITKRNMLGLLTAILSILLLAVA
ncbi:MAG: EamA family transporter [Bacteroidia bacterium]|jgi:drug/metabolite transporter (DMT)-like permease|nr:EamA family transporter [Bacteroidia bacterium]